MYNTARWPTFARAPLAITGSDSTKIAPPPPLLPDCPIPPRNSFVSLPFSVNVYSQLTAALRDALLSGLSPAYTDIQVVRREFRPSHLPLFDRYCVVISPADRPWDEDMSTANRSVRDIVRCNLYCLVKNFADDDEETAVYGTDPGSLGLFELVQDAKELVRLSTLGDLIEKTYAEVAGDPRFGGGGGMQYGRIAAPGFETGDYAFVFRALLPVLVRMKDIRCLPIVT